MKVKVKCYKCKKEFKASADNIKEARIIKRIYKETKFTCWECMGINNGVYGVGVIG